jgi:hypothetical protein
MTRPDYCPVAKEPCQSMCDKPCSPNPGLLIDSEYASRLAFMLECLIVDYHGHWDAACKLLDEYKAAWEKVNPVFMDVNTVAPRRLTGLARPRSAPND